MLKEIDNLLIKAVLEKEPKVVAFLLKKGANPNTQYIYSDGSLLSLAVGTQDLETIRSLLQMGVDTSKYSVGLQPIHSAVKITDIEIIKLLLQYGAKIDPLSYEGTPLLQAFNSNNNELMDLFLDYGADQNIKIDGSTIWERVKSSFSRKKKKIFTQERSYSSEQLREAISTGNLYKANKIVKLNNLNLTDFINKDPTLLIEQVTIGNLHVVKYLVENGADVNLEKENITPLYIASIYGFTPLIEYLLSKNANPEVVKDGNTPLLASIQIPNLNNIELLLKYKANFLQDGWINSALYRAHIQNDEDVRKNLYNHYLDYLIKNPPVQNISSNKSFEVVIVRYDENLEWAKYEFDNNTKVTIYNKGADDLELPNYFNIIKTENIGYLGGTFLKHMAERYDTLADRTLLLQGYPYDIPKYLPLIRYKDVTELSCKNIYAFCTNTTLEYEHNFISRMSWKNTKYHKFNLENKTIIDFNDKYIGFKSLNYMMTVAYGAEFAVDKEKILCHSQEFYQRIFLEFQDQFAVEDFFMERTWDLLLDC